MKFSSEGNNVTMLLDPNLGINSYEPNCLRVSPTHGSQD